MRDKILLILITLSLSLLQANAAKVPERVYDIDHQSPAILNMYAGTKNLLRVNYIPNYIEQAQLVPGSSKSMSKVIGRRNKVPCVTPSGSYVEYRVNLSEDADLEIFRFKTFVRSGESGYKIAESYPIKVQAIRCPALENPVCGLPNLECDPDAASCPEASPVTYKNLCEMNKANATLLYKGTCE